jgi:DNA repair exonuclease SbcCD nuclease subunit
MKILFYSDIHIRQSNRKWIEIALNEVKRIALEKRVDWVINCGDTFNTRGLLHTADFDLLQGIYSDWNENGISQIIVVGNHDQEDKAGKIHPMKIFDCFKNWIIVDKPIYLESLNFWFCPYIYDRKETEQAILSAPINSYAVVHWGIAGAQMNDFRIDEDGIPVKWIKKFKKVFSGHYHLRNTFENVQYIGSLLQKDFNEMGCDKGVLLYDIETDNLEFIEVKGTPKHYEIIVSFRNDKPIVQKPDGITDIDMVRAKVVGASEQVSQISKEVLRSEFNVEVAKINRDIEDKSLSRLSVGVDEIYNMKSVMEKYVDFVSTPLDKERLIKIGQEFI